MKIPVLYGVTHDEQGGLTVRLPRSVKIGIGLPKGAKAHVCMFREEDGRDVWVIRRQEAQGEGYPRWKTYKFPTRAEAEKAWPQLEQGGIELRAPEKLSYFTFSVMGKDGALHPAWELIEMHGPQPTSIPIGFSDNEPLEQAYRWWAQTKKVCEGDGKNALRHVDHADTPEQQKAADQAKAEGRQYFPIVRGCALYGCPHRQKKTYINKKGKEATQRGDCAIHTRLSFQLAKSPRLGSSATYDSTGTVTAIYLSGSLVEVAKWTGGGYPERGVVAGFELNLKLVPVHNKQYGSVTHSVFVELADETLMALRRRLISQATEFDRLMVNGHAEPRQIAGPRLQLAAPLSPVEVEDADDEDGITVEQEAAMMYAEFSDSEDEGDPEPVPAPKAVRQVASATTDKAAALADRVASIRAKKDGTKPTAPKSDEFGVGPEDVSSPEPESAGVAPEVVESKPGGRLFPETGMRATKAVDTKKSAGGWE